MGVFLNMFEQRKNARKLFYFSIQKMLILRQVVFNAHRYHQG